MACFGCEINKLRFAEKIKNEEQIQNFREELKGVLSRKIRLGLKKEENKTALKEQLSNCVCADDFKSFMSALQNTLIGEKREKR